MLEHSHRCAAGIASRHERERSAARLLLASRTSSAEHAIEIAAQRLARAARTTAAPTIHIEIHVQDVVTVASGDGSAEDELAETLCAC